MRGFGGFLGELNRQAEDAGNMAARGALDEDLAPLIRRREHLVAAAEKKAEAKEHLKSKRLARMESAIALLRVVLGEIR